MSTPLHRLVVGIILLPLSQANDSVLSSAVFQFPTPSPAPTISNIPSSTPTVSSAPTSSCSVCATPGEYEADRLYPHWQLRCHSLGEATESGLDCVEDIQKRFGAFCGCPGAVAECKLCPSDATLPNPNKVIPLLWSGTCEDVNLYSSLRSSSDCSSHLNAFPFDLSAFCECSGATTPTTSKCSFCPPGFSVADLDHEPTGAYGSTCGEIADLAQYVTDGSYCSYVRGFAIDCCTTP